MLSEMTNNLPHAILKNPTIHAAIAPEVDSDLRFTPRDAISVATVAARTMLIKPNGFIFHYLCSAWNLNLEPQLN